MEDPLLHSAWNDEAYFGGNMPAVDLINVYSRDGWIRNYLGYTLPYASEEEIQALRLLPEVKAMPCWPSAGSIKVLGDMVVIKCQE